MNRWEKDSTRDPRERATAEDLRYDTGHRVAKPNRASKVRARRSAMPVNGRSVFTIQATIVKRARL